MNTPSLVHPWSVRITIDVDPALNPIGWSATQRTNGEDVAIIITGAPGPFDTPAELLQEALRSLTDAVGTLQRLF